MVTRHVRNCYFREYMCALTGNMGPLLVQAFQAVQAEKCPGRSLLLQWLQTILDLYVVASKFPKVSLCFLQRLQPSVSKIALIAVRT